MWSILHFPFHLSIVGVVEGSQQLALARYTIKNSYKVTNKLIETCVTQNLNGSKLRDKLVELLEYFELDRKLETRSYFNQVSTAIYKIGNATNICSPTNATSYVKDEHNHWPDDFVTIDSGIANGVYVGLGMKLPIDKLEKYQPIQVATQGWWLVYMYYWACFCAMMLCLIVFLLLIRRHKADLFDFTSVISRTIVLGVGAALLGLIADKERLYAALATPMLLPICVILMFLVLCIDKLSCVWCNWRLKKNGQPYALEVEEHEHGGHEHHDDHTPHGSVHEVEPLRGHGHHDSVNLEDARKTAHYSVYSDTAPLHHQTTEYHNGQQGYGMSPLMSPPLMSPDPTTPAGATAKPSGPGGYMPVSSGQNYGA